MNKTMLPVFEFLGYSLMDCNFHRDFETGRPQKLFIIVNDFNVSDKKIARMNILVKITFESGSESEFKYHSQFKINDLDWLDKANKEHQNLGISNLFSIVFPYVRASVSSITNDSLHQIFLPVINVLEGDITKGVSFTSYIKKK